MRCPIHPAKVRYATETAAASEADRQSLITGAAFRAYKCYRVEGGCGWWHLTTKPKRTYEQTERNEPHG